jgi:hypothetical protein
LIDSKDIHDFVWSYGITDLTYDTRRRQHYADYLHYSNDALDAYIEAKEERLYTMKLPEHHLTSIIEITKEFAIERNLRRMNPAVAKAYEHYQMLLNLTRYEYEEYTKNKK